MAFWGNRAVAMQKQIESGKRDQGERGAVTSGKNMDGFLSLVRDLVRANGLPDNTVRVGRAPVTLPGFFRPTKCWDLLVINDGRLVAAVEFKSQAGSFGKNFNNRIEEVIGAGQDFRTAYREGAFGEISPPFVGWLMLLEDAPDTRATVRFKSPNYPLFPDFEGELSRVELYDILCKKLMQEQVYTTASLVVSPRSAVGTGNFSSASEVTSLKTFVANFAGHIAAEAARS